MLTILQRLCQPWTGSNPAECAWKSHLRRFTLYFLLMAAILFHARHFGFNGDESGYVSPNTAEIASHPFNPFIFEIDTGHPIIYTYPVAVAWRLLGMRNVAANIAMWVYAALALTALHALARRMLARAPKKRAPAWLGAASALALLSTPMFISLTAQYLDPMPYLAALLLMVLAWASGRRIALGVLAVLLALIRITGSFSVLGLGLFDLGYQWFVLRRRSWRGVLNALAPYAATGAVVFVYMSIKLFVLHRPMSTIRANKMSFAGWAGIQRNIDWTLGALFRMPRYCFTIMLVIAGMAVIVTLVRRGLRRLRGPQAGAAEAPAQPAAETLPGGAAIYGALFAAMLAPTLFYIIDFVWFLQPRYLLFWHALLVIMGVHGLAVLLGRRAWLVLPVLGLWCGLQVTRWHGHWVDRALTFCSPRTRGQLSLGPTFSLDVLYYKELTGKAVNWVRRKSPNAATFCNYPTTSAFGCEFTGYGPVLGVNYATSWISRDNPKDYLYRSLREGREVYFVLASWDIPRESKLQSDLMALIQTRECFSSTAPSKAWIRIYKYNGLAYRQLKAKDRMEAKAKESSQTTSGTRRVEFGAQTTQAKWTLKELDPKLPADWTPYDYLTLDFKASSPLFFEISLFTGSGVRRVRVHPFQGALTRVSIPLAGFQRPPSSGHDLASVANKSRPSSFIGPRGDYGPINAVEAFGIAMFQPIGKPTLEFSNIHLTKGKPEDAVLAPKPLVDEFGQWILDKWPGKAHTLAELKAAWDREEHELRPGDFDTCAYGGFKGTHAKATGFFRVEQAEGKWWLVDPDGHDFFSVGATGMRTRAITPIAGRDGVFAALPPAEGNSATSRTEVSFSYWNLQRRFGTDPMKPWIDLTMRRMDDWGLNTIGNWSDPHLWDAHRKPYVVNLGDLGIEKGILGLPDVYAADYPRQVDRALAAQCAPRKSDPWLIGYFLANEPAWALRGPEVAGMILSGPERPIKRELKAFLATGDTPARREAFVLLTFERFLAITREALRRHDPNHLNLGVRFGGSHAPDDVLRACRNLDVFSMNVYAYAPDKAYFAKVNKLCGRPILVGEFGFGTPGRGLTVGLRQTVNHEQRAAAYRYYIEQAAALPFVVGAHWFEWLDEANTGRNDGEDFNVGIVDVTDRPYPELIGAFKASHKRLLAVHTGKEAPVTRQARIQ